MSNSDELEHKRPTSQIGQRVVVPGGRTGTVTGIKSVWVQLDGVASRNYCEVTDLQPEHSDHTSQVDLEKS